jgi:TRAP-type C4-dicarboxylate transport system permease small subunit
MISKIDTLLDKISFYGIVTAVLLMLSLTVLNIILRWFNTSILWIDPLVRHLVFLSAFLGGSLATGKDNHIRIDLASKALENLNKPGLKLWIERFVYIVTLIALILLTKAGIDFTKMELEFGKEVFLGLHSGLMAAIIPFGMGLIGLRYFLRLLLTFTKEGVPLND